MRRFRAEALAGAAGLAVGLWASGAGMSCVVLHVFDAQDINCPALNEPQCCDGCGGAAVVDPVCTDFGWSCPPPTVSSFDCSGGRSRLCLPPVVVDAGFCVDAGQGPSQEQYTAVGCQPQTYVCPNDGTLYCALRALQSQHEDCRFTAECVAAPLSGVCTGWGSCPPFAVNDAGLSAFLDAGRAEVARYCACPGCAWTGMCSDQGKGSAHCVYGKCTWVGGQVSYACADRRTGQCFPACAEDEACYTQVACIPAPDGGCLGALDGGTLDAGTPDAGRMGDDLCHLRCAADGGCPAGQACFAVAFFGCGSPDAGAPVTNICCAADAGCR
jgi:hypothetical protein